MFCALCPGCTRRQSANLSILQHGCAVRVGGAFTNFLRQRCAAHVGGTFIIFRSFLRRCAARAGGTIFLRQCAALTGGTDTETGASQLVSQMPIALHRPTCLFLRSRSRYHACAHFFRRQSLVNLALKFAIIVPGGRCPRPKHRL